MTTEYTGGCHCGKVRYSCSVEPEMTFFCHCNDCQKTTGSPFSVELMIVEDGFELTGATSTYVVTGDSGKAVFRHFCPECGSGIYLAGDADPGWIFLKAGTLDDGSWVEPDMHIYTAARQPWMFIGDALPQSEKAPEM